MQNDEGKIVHGLMPLNDGNEDGSVDGPRWRGVLARVAYWQLILNQLMTTPSAVRLMNGLLVMYHEDYCLDPRYAERDPPSQEKIVYEHFRGQAETKEYLALAPRLGDPIDADGVDRLVQGMIDAASGPGGPIICDGDRMLAGSAGPHFHPDSTLTERVAHVLLYHADRGRPLRPEEGVSLWERTDYPRVEEFRPVAFLHERIAGSLPALYAAIRGLEAKRIIEVSQGRSGMRVRLCLPYLHQSADDRAAWCKLRDAGLLPITRGDGGARMTPTHKPPLPISRPYHNFRAGSQVLESIQQMMADGITSPTAMTVMIVIAKHLDEVSGLSTVSYPTLYTEGMVPPRTASGTVAALVKAGYLERTSGGLPNRANTYRFGVRVQTFTEETKTSASGRKPSPNPTTEPSRLSRLLNSE
jgi:hypothetical protein